MNIKERMVDFQNRFNPYFEAAVKQVIEEQLSFHETKVDLDDELSLSFLRYITNGKRIRPFLIELLSGKSINSDDDVFNTAMSTELFHLMALIHDDIIDQSPLRRGVPTIHVAVEKYARYNERLGEDVAILLGDSFLVECLRYANKLKPELFDVITTNLQRTVRGQYLDAFGMNISYGETDPSVIEARQTLKTAWYTFAGPAKLGLMLSEYELSPKDLEKIVSVYVELGLLFQIRDDIIDCDPNRKDKQPCEDILEGQTTWVTLKLKESYPEVFQTIKSLREQKDTKGILKAISHVDLVTPYQRAYQERKALVEDIRSINQDIYESTKEVLQLLNLPTKNT